MPFAIDLAPNGLRYPRVGLPAQAGGTRSRHFDGTNFKPRKLPENAQTPTRRVHAVLGWRLTLFFLFHFGLSTKKLQEGLLAT